MPDAELLYSPTKVKWAGKILRDQEPGSKGYADAFEVFKNWRSCHSVPLNLFYDSLQGYALDNALSIYVVHRPKRIEAVIKKLRREKPAAQLSTMQDIAGCRAIVGSIDDVYPLIESCKQMWSQHTLVRKPYDYIQEPNSETGYRGVHLVYRFRSNNKSFDGRLVEVQIRTHAQHAWATAVETVDLIERQSLKFGHGDRLWKRFFVLMGSLIAANESSPLVSSAPADQRELDDELRHCEGRLRVRRRLRAYSAIASVIQQQHEGMIDYSLTGEGPLWVFLVELDLASKRTSVTGYAGLQIRQAYQDVADAEREGKNVVLAGAYNFAQLKEAYPNWFVDTRNFLMLLNTALGEDVSTEV